MIAPATELAARRLLIIPATVTADFVREGLRRKLSTNDALGVRSAIAATGSRVPFRCSIQELLLVSSLQGAHKLRLRLEGCRPTGELFRCRTASFYSDRVARLPFV